MARISLSIAKKFQEIIEGKQIPFSKVKGNFVQQMIEDGVLSVRVQGRSRKYLFCTNKDVLSNYLRNEFGINNLQVYINNFDHGSTRAENILASTNSKHSSVRTLKGFLVNCYTPINATIEGKEFVIHPQEGCFIYIYNYESLSIDKEVTIIGVENPENFRYIHNQKYLFRDRKVLFVSRYPQSKDLIKWLLKIPNKYIHFGDFDFEGIRIFRDEYYQYLGERASFYITPKIEKLLNLYGNKDLYDKQYKSAQNLDLNNEINSIISLFHRYKKCLEQEVLINRTV